MKSDFMMAINQVCHERQLPPEVVLEAVEVALVSAYKRNYGSNKISAKVDRDSGEVKIFIEKEVVEDVLDDKNEIDLAGAKKIVADVEMGDVVQIENTPANFGRIAAQTTKQVILQRIREAEREALYRTYAEREGEIVNGTVHKVDAHQVILSLGKVEAILPRAEQIPTERYVAGQRLRAYVSEVTKTPRGPQIIVSRTHRNMLRRLLEVEVPEIYNGTVEIKAIAREAGYRSKVAVAALQDGVDPVGSCVGMRGVRIQSIVNELGGEKIDVAEWSPNTRVFIANALSPAKVLNVILHDIGGDKTASVVVPDKQLSLAIGKEGQNARLAAKLTNWRIDIKSALEAVKEAIERAKVSNRIKELVSGRPEVFALASAIISERQDGSDLTPGELNLISEAIDLVGQAELQIEREKYEADRTITKDIVVDSDLLAKDSLEEVDLLSEAEAILQMQDHSGTEDGEADDSQEPSLTPEAEQELLASVEAKLETDEAIAEEAKEAKEELDSELISMAKAVEAELGISIEELEEWEASEPAQEPEIQSEPQIEAEAADEAENIVEPEEEAEDEEGVEFIPSILDSIVEEKPKKETKKLKPVIVTSGSDFAIDDELDPDKDDKKRSKSKRRTLEYDEDLNQVVVKHKRKKSRKRDEWEDYLG